MAVTLVVNTNTWVTLAETNNYIEGIPNSTSWTALSDTAKKQYIIKAYRLIQFSNNFNTSSVTQLLKNAQCELAYWLSNYMAEWEKRQALYASGVREFELPRWQEKLDKAQLPQFIIDMLRDLIKKGNYFNRVTRTLD